MSRSLAQAFDQFIRQIEPTKKQNEAAKRQKNHIRECLDTHMKLDDVIISGSYGRRTAIRPLHDVDMFIVLNEHVHGALRRQSPKACLDMVLKTLQREYNEKVSKRPQRRSVNISFRQSGIGYDIVPAFAIEPKVYLIPDTDRTAWIKTNPVHHAKICKQANERAKGKLNPLIKAAKHWNGEHGKQLGSFHIEVMAYDAFGTPPPSLPKGMAELFAYLARRIQDACSDPAGVGPNIDKGLTQSQRTQFARQFDNAAEKLARALELEEQGTDGSIRQAHEIFYKLLKDRYPRP